MFDRRGTDWELLLVWGASKNNGIFWRQKCLFPKKKKYINLENYQNN
jgi:hypothetical protein